MKFKIIPAILINLLFTVHLCAQQTQIDSLHHLLNHTSQAAKKAKYLNELGNTYRRSKLDSAYKYTLLAKQIAEQNNISEQQVEAYTELGIIYYMRNNRDSSQYYLLKGYTMARENEDYQGMVKSLNSQGLYKTKAQKYSEASAILDEALQYINKIIDSRLTVMVYNNLAILSKARGDAEKALEYYHQALTISEEQNDTKSIGLIASNMGLLYERQNKTDLALKYLNKSLDIRLNNRNKLGESYVRTNIGLVYENLQEYENALAQYRKSLAIKQEIGSKKGTAILFNNMAIIFKKQTLYDSAYHYANKALPLRIELNDKLGEARTRTVLGQVHLQNNNKTEAQTELNKALQLANNYKNYTVLQNIHSSLYEVYASQKNYKEALAHLLRQNEYKDRIFSIQKEKSIADIEAKYNSLKKEKENLQLARENELKDGEIKRQIMIGTGLITLVFLSFSLLLLVYRSRRKLSVKNKEIKQQTIQLNETFTKLKQLSEFKEAMTNMLVHDLKTPLNVVLNVKTLRGMDTLDDLILQSGYNMQNLVHNILDVYKCQHSKIELNKHTICISDVLNKAFEEISFLSTVKKLNICIESTLDYIVDADEDLLKRVLVNLLTNAIKFTPEKETILISTKIERSEELRIGIANPGPGIPKEKQELIFEYFKQAEQATHENIKSSGLGLSFCKLAIEAHKGEIGVISETAMGVEFWFTLPGVKQEKQLTKNCKFDWVSIGFP